MRCLGDTRYGTGPTVIRVALADARSVWFTVKASGSESGACVQQRHFDDKRWRLACLMGVVTATS